MTLYLIAHKVRGEPAFDVAQKIMIGSEEGWLIPTSGHRAYPYRWWLIEDLVDGSDYDTIQPWTVTDRMPDDLRDHYAISKPKNSPTKLTTEDLLSTLGL